jgi:hypothetical protein
MKGRRNIRKRQFEAAKSLRLFREYSTLYQYLNGENADENNLSTFEAQERYENKDKITEMFLKKKKNIIIPTINKKFESEEKKSIPSETSENTDITNLYKKEEKPAVEFKFKQMGKVQDSYIKYKPRMVGIQQTQDFSRIDYMITEEEWTEIKSSSNKILDSMKDLVEEVIDKFEKLAGKEEVKPLDKCKEFIQTLQLKSKTKLQDNLLKAIYSAWFSMRKKNGNPLMRMFWRKPDPNDNSPNASFRSRVAEKMQTRRKNKNDNSNFMKLKLLRKEIFAGRTLVGMVMQREKSKLAQLDLDYMEIKQMLMEKQQPEYR